MRVQQGVFKLSTGNVGSTKQTRLDYPFVVDRTVRYDGQDAWHTPKTSFKLEVPLCACRAPCLYREGECDDHDMQ